MAVIDVHTHMLTEEYLEFLGANSGPKYERKATAAGQDSIFMLGAPFMTLMPEMWDYDARIRDMDRAGVDLAVVSLTCPNAYFGDESVSCKAAAMVNDDMEAQQIGSLSFILLMLPIYLLMVIIPNPNGLVALAFSFFPPTSIITFGVRSLVAGSNPAPWEPRSLSEPSLKASADLQPLEQLAPSSCNPWNSLRDFASGDFAS